MSKFIGMSKFIDEYGFERDTEDIKKKAYQQGREDAIEEFLTHLLNDVEFVSLEDEIKIRNLFIGIAEQIKEKNSNSNSN